LESITLGHPLLDDFLAFVAVRARTNTRLAVASDLKIFFGVVAMEPTQVTPNEQSVRPAHRNGVRWQPSGHHRPAARWRPRFATLAFRLGG
jgi:hypothetical protein